MKPEEIDYYCCVLFGGEMKTDDGNVVIVDAEGEEVCYAPSLEMGEYIANILNLAEEIRQVVERNPEHFVATPAGRSIIDGQRWPPPNNDIHTHFLERVIAKLGG